MAPSPLPFAREDEPEDEDQLDREDEHGDEGDDCEHTLYSIVDAMSRRGPPAVQAVREFAAALNEVADAVVAEDDDQFQRAAHHACAAFQAIDDGEGGGDYRDDEGEHDGE